MNIRLHRLPLVVVRACSAAALLAVSIYYLLASIPFAYYHFLQFAHFWWLPWFVHGRSLVMAIGVVLLLMTLGDASREWRVRLALVGGLPAVWMVVSTLVPWLDSYETAALMCFAPLVLLGLAGAVDLHANRQTFARVCPVHASVQPLVESAALSGLIAWVIYLAIGISALRHARDPLQIRDLLFAGAVSLAGHLVVFLAPAGAIALVGVLGRRWRWRPGVEWLAGGVCLTVALALVIRRIALSALLMDDRYALLVSLTASIASTLFWMALMARWHASTGTADDIELSMFPVSPGPDAQWGALVVSAALLGGVRVRAAGPPAAGGLGIGAAEKPRPDRLAGGGAAGSFAARRAAAARVSRRPGGDSGRDVADDGRARGERIVGGACGDPVARRRARARTLRHGRSVAGHHPRRVSTDADRPRFLHRAEDCGRRHRQPIAARRCRCGSCRNSTVSRPIVRTCS